MSLRSSTTPNYIRRKVGDWLMRGATVLCTLIAIVPLVLIIGYVLVVGGKALNTEFFTQAYLPPLTIDTGVTAPDLGAPAGAPAAEPPPADSIALNPSVAQPTVTNAAPQAADATADPFANIDVGALAGAGTEPLPTTGMPPADAATTQQPVAMPATDVVARGGVLHGIVGTLLVTG
ncbi:MAG: hypothetical protein ABI901_15685, partial [Roseiflexaceae bacterium]